MAETQIKYLSLTGLASYDAKIKAFIETKVSEGDAPAFKYVNLEEGVLKFYTINPILENTEAAFEIELPVQDLSNLMALVQNAVSGNIATFGEGGQVVDSGVALDSLATKAEVEAVDAIADQNTADIEEMKGKIDALEKGTYDDTEVRALIQANTDSIGVLNGDKSVDGSVDKKVSDAINEFATQITEDGTINTFKEVLNYIGTHGGEASEMMAAIDQLETLVGSKSVATQIAEAIEAENLDQYATDTELAEVIARIVVLEGIDHEHANATVLDGITAEKVAAWDASETNAKTYADEEIAKIDLSGITTNASAITVLQEKDVAVDGKIATIEEDIAELQSIQHIEISEEDIANMFK